MITENSAPSPSDIGLHLADNVRAFGQVLFRCGLSIPPTSIIAALDALRILGVGSRHDVYWALHSTLINSPADRTVFDLAFHQFWRSSNISGFNLPDPMVLTPLQRDQDKRPPAARRVKDALESFLNRPPPAVPPEHQPTPFRLPSSDPIKKNRDFAQMTAQELESALQAITKLRFPNDSRLTRRCKPSRRQIRIDPNRTLRIISRQGGDLSRIAFKAPGQALRPVIALCDISGSMAEYIRVFLHFIHAMGQQKNRRVECFIFGTQLTSITNAMQLPDPDAALTRAVTLANDWSGGTRIEQSLRDFNRNWIRRTSTRSANLFFFSDGLEKDPGVGLGQEMARLRRSSHRLIWLNPLLRYDQFEPRAGGIRLLKDHVDCFFPIHNLDAVSDLCTFLTSG